MPGTRPGQHAVHPDGGEDLDLRNDHDLEADEGADPAGGLRPQPGETTAGDLADEE